MNFSLSRANETTNCCRYTGGRRLYYERRAVEQMEVFRKPAVRGGAGRGRGAGQGRGPVTLQLM